MPQIINFSVEIEGTSIEYFSSFELSQGIYEHHFFRMAVPAEAIDGRSGVFHTSKNLIGSTITIKVQPMEMENVKLQFVGVIAQVEIARHGGHSGDLVISGYSPTIMLDNGPHCKAWENMDLRSIVNHVLTHFPQNLLKPKVGPAHSGSLPYVVQYKESAWQFLCRLGATFGEWFYYDGEKLIMASPQGEKQSLRFGYNLHSFNMSLQVRPPGFTLVGHDYTSNEVYKSTPRNVSGDAGLNDLGKTAYSKSQQFYGVQPKDWHGLTVSDQKSLDDRAKARSAMEGSNLVRFNGTSDHPALRPGSIVSVDGSSVFDDGSESYGDFTVISVHHHFDAQGNYSNDFVAIPASVKMPPVELHDNTRCETQSGEVTDNNDPDKMGRVRVRLRWMTNSERTPWVRIASPHGGNGKGMYFVPEVGEEVMVGFEGDSPDNPFIIGMVWNGKNTVPFGNEGNDVKALQTKSGNFMIMNDKEGSVHVADAKGNDVLIDGSGNIKITGSESIVLTSGDSSISLKKDGTIEITGKNIKITADEKATMASGQASFKADGQSNEADMAGMTVKIKGEQEVDVEGLQTSIKASTKVEINGQAQVNIGSSAMVAVKGAMIMLN
ncbi:MAG TPA: type VI secretion system Vgr family protein [Puia sp.]|nr:type VI secretion system Vgr family protein [Puia sp.]